MLQGFAYHLAQYVVGTMLAWVPAESHAYTHVSSDYTVSRYEDIANDIVEVVIDEGPLEIWQGQPLDDDVDKHKKLGDRGKSHCLMQVMLRPGEHIKPGDRQQCFRLGLERIRESMAACPSLLLEHRLAVYASGSCVLGLEESEHRMKRALNWIASTPYYSTEIFEDTSNVLALDKQDPI